MNNVEYVRLAMEVLPQDAAIRELKSYGAVAILILSFSFGRLPITICHELNSHARCLL